MKNLSYSEILELNKELAGNVGLIPAYNIAVLSNCTTNFIKEILEYSLKTEGINAQVKIGNYDNIVQDSMKYKTSNMVMIFWELCNLIDGLQYKVELFNDNQMVEIFQKTKSEIDLVIKNLGNTPLVLMNKFTAVPFLNANPGVNKLEQLAIRLNQYLESQKLNNLKLIDVDRILANVGLEKSIDLRFYYSSKALYTVALFKAYTQAIKPFVMAVNGKSKKALIFDCDHTLWKGILGEDGPENIKMTPKTKDGAVFAEVQSLAKTLSQQGVLVGLCTKNNEKDVNEVIKFHPDMQLRDEDITIKKINWSDKLTNLREIAQELDIGLDSIVFVDDSPFEVNLVREQLPEVVVLQVPERLEDYPKLLRKQMGLFYNISLTSEDSRRAAMYKDQVKRENAQKEFSNIENYLASLDLKMTIFEDEEPLLERLAQMTQKTNQFNLTTKRYTENDIKNFIISDSTKVYAFSLSDKFGDNGVTGLSIIHLTPKTQTADIDTFLMSCRVIGRNIEYAFMNYLIESLRDNNIKTVKAWYITTSKNELTRDFYDHCSFSVAESNDAGKTYILNSVQYQPKLVSYIEVVHETKNQKNYVSGV